MHLNILKHIFSRPYLAALIVGSLIHVGKWLNYSAHNMSYSENILKLAEIGNIFLIVDILMPYLIPFVVISISRYLAKIKEKEFYETFPDMNPDIIIKCDNSGNPKYFNTRAKELLLEMNVQMDQIDILIPATITMIDAKKIELPCRMQHDVMGKKVEYLISKSDDNELFLSGRIIHS